MKLRTLITAFFALFIQIALGQSPGGDLFIERFLGPQQSRAGLLFNQYAHADGLGRAVLLDNVPQYWIAGVSNNLLFNKPGSDYEKLYGRASIPIQWSNRTGRPQRYSRYFNEYNVAQSLMGDRSINYRGRYRLNDKNTMQLMGNVHRQRNDRDNNDDGFLDDLQQNRTLMLAQWRAMHNNFHSMVSAFYLRTNQWGGQTNFDRDTHRGTTDMYGFGGEVDHFSVAGTMSLRLPNKRWITVNYSAENHTQERYFGLRSYRGQEERYSLSSAYSFTRRMHETSAGISGDINAFDESLDSLNVTRNERSVGAWVRYRTQYGNKLRFTGTFRADYHNLFDWLVSPQAVAEYQPIRPLHFTGYAQFGSRTPNFFTENMDLFNSARQLNWNYELEPEQALRGGLSVSYSPNTRWIFQAVANRTGFTDRLVMDLYSDPGTINVYNLDGTSVENQLDVRVRSRIRSSNGGWLFDRRGKVLMGAEVVYRYTDATLEYTSGKQAMPFVAPHQFFVRGFYNLQGSILHVTWWQASETAIPLAAGIPVNGSNHGTAPSRHQMDVRLDVPLLKKPGMMIYFGADNITGQQQAVPVVGSDNPFGGDFDAGLQWGNTLGARWYGGLSFQF